MSQKRKLRISIISLEGENKMRCDDPQQRLQTVDLLAGKIEQNAFDIFFLMSCITCKTRILHFTWSILVPFCIASLFTDCANTHTHTHTHFLPAQKEIVLVWVYCCCCVVRNTYTFAEHQDKSSTDIYLTKVGVRDKFWKGRNHFRRRFINESSVLFHPPTWRRQVDISVRVQEKFFFLSC